MSGKQKKSPLGEKNENDFTYHRLDGIQPAFYFRRANRARQTGRARCTDIFKLFDRRVEAGREEEQEVEQEIDLKGQRQHRRARCKKVVTFGGVGAGFAWPLHFSP